MSLYGRREGKRFSIYVPEDLVPEVREAIANGRRVQELVSEAGVRYTQALKAKRRKEIRPVKRQRGRGQGMLSEQDFAAWAKRIGLSDEALSVVAHVRCSDPARRVGGGRSNVTGRYPSKKMGVTIQFESHRVELPTVFELEHDDEVLEYYDQAPSIKLDYSSADGKHLGRSSYAGLLCNPHEQRRVGRV